MLVIVFLTFLDLFVLVFSVLLVVRVFSSYIIKPTNGFYAALVNLTEPILMPVRQLLPTVPGVDIAPLAAFFLLQGIQYLAHLLLGA